MYTVLNSNMKEIGYYSGKGHVNQAKKVPHHMNYASNARHTVYVYTHVPGGIKIGKYRVWRSKLSKAEKVKIAGKKRSFEYERYAEVIHAPKTLEISRNSTPAEKAAAIRGFRW